MFASRKRARDEEDDDFEELARVTMTITPADSSEEETSPSISSPTLSQSVQSASQPIYSTTSPIIEPSIDMDVDMADTHPRGSPRYLGQASAMPSPRASPSLNASTLPTFRNPFRDTQSAASGGRLPTPIYGHFQQSVDAKMDMGEDPETIIPRTQQEIEYEKYVRRRRLPTPIDEDGVMDSTVPDSINYSTPFSITPSWVPASSKFTPPARATRLSFSMGIRADCDLCRMRVPGHSNHIFRA
ncbi:hypothetical protein ACLMJK_004658 [Lecanora helva]